MTSTTPDRRWSPAASSRLLALAPGLTVVAALTILDVWLQPHTVIIGIVVLAPLLTALFGSSRDVAVTGAVAVLIVALSAAWHDNFGEAAYVYRIGVISAVAVAASLAARGRERVARDRERFALLSAVAEFADELEPGDVLVLYTDGVFDAVGEDGRFGEELLAVERLPVATPAISTAGALARADRPRG